MCDMENTEPPKPNIRTRCLCFVRVQCCDLGDFFKTWFCHSLAKVTGNKCEERKVLTLFVASICLCLMSVGLINVSLYVKNYLWKTADIIPAESFDAPNIEQPASVVSATTDINIETPKKDLEDTFSKCDLNTGEWVRWLGTVNQDFEDKTHFILPTNSSGALFKYVGKIDDFSSCEFVFIPRSENSINYVLSLDEIYQIVIGDNDFWTIAVRATDAIGGELIPIKEDSTQKTRPRLLNKIKNGTTVKVALNQKFINEDTYQIELNITYKPDTEILNETQTDKFMWTFEPSPAILKKPSLSVGLIIGLSDKSEISVNFVDPKVVQKNDNLNSESDN